MIKQLLALSISATLYGCGGSSDSSSTTTQTDTSTPVVDTQSPAVISGTDSGSVTDGGTSVATGTLTITDEQTDEASFQAQTDAVVDFGSFSLTSEGDWNFTLNANNSALSALAADAQVAVEISVYSVDDTAHTVTITVNGVNDAAEFGAAEANTLSANTTDPLTGSVTVTDVDNGEGSLIAQDNVTLTYGTFSISESGVWSYILDTANSDVLGLIAGASLEQSITILSDDDTAHNIIISVTGVNDVAEFTVTESNTINADAIESITGSVMVTDVDTGEGTIVAQTDFASSYGTFSITDSGEWSYNVDVANNDVLNLAENATLDDVMTLTSDDGSSTNITMTIVGVARDDEDNFVMQSEVTLDSDGIDTGLSAYTLIENAFAEGSIEAPDVYETNHTEVEHILEDTDDTVGDHFVFLAHRDEDYDKDNDPSDRQRNEIKAYDKSAETLLAYENDTFQYSWKFKVSSEMELSSKFSHFFQLKARNYSDDNTNGNDGHPIITLSAAEKSSSGNQLQVRYNTGYDTDGESTSDIYLDTAEWSLITDEWVEVFVQTTYAEEGKFKLTLTRLSDEAIIFDIEEDNIDTWRGFAEGDFVRPKWGIYRSISETDSLREDEEQVRFANFSVKKGVLSE